LSTTERALKGCKLSLVCGKITLAGSIIFNVGVVGNLKLDEFLENLNLGGSKSL
jgi:hypothetical protein